MATDDTVLDPADHDAVVRTVLAEAGSPDGWGAVANVIKNRLAAGTFGDTPSAIVHAPKQFEVWSDGSAQSKDPSSPQYAQASRVVNAVMAGGLPDNSNGATHFFSASGQAARAGDGRQQVPGWATNHTADVAGNSFFAPNGVITYQSKPAGAPSPVSFGAPSSGTASDGPAAGGLSDDDLDAMLSGKASSPASSGMSPPASAPAAASPGGAPSPMAAPSTAPTPGTSGGDLSDDALDAMLSGKASAPPASSSPASGASPAGGMAPLTIRGAAPAAPATTPASGPFGSINRAAFGAPPPVSPAPVQPADYLPGASRTASAAPADPSATLDPEGTGSANYDTGPASDGLTPGQRLAGLPGLGANMLAQAAQGVPVVGAGVNKLAAGLAGLVNGRSQADNEATGAGISADFAQAHPALTLASRLAGGAIGTAPLIAAAPGAFGLGEGGTLATRLGLGASSNALLAATDAGVRGDDVRDAAILGGGLGAAGPVAGKIAELGVGGLASKVGTGINALSNYFSGRGASGVAGMSPAALKVLLADAANDGGMNALSAAVQRLGPDAMLADAGPVMKNAAQGLSATPGSASKALVDNALTIRGAGRNARVASDVDAALGPAVNPTPIREGIEQGRDAMTAPLYARAYAAGVQDPEALAALAQRPAIRNALMDSATSAANRGAPLSTVTLDAAGNPVAADAPLQALEARSRPAVTSALADALGVDPSAGPLAIGDRLAAQRSAAADPAYAAYRSMDVPMTPELADVLSRPSVRAALPAAERKAADQGRSIYVSHAADDAGTAARGSTDIPDPVAGLGEGPGVLGRQGTGEVSDAASVGSGAPQRPTGPAPTSLVSFLQRAGGVKDEGGDLAAAGFNRFPGLVRDGGMSLDRAREAAAEAGYMGGDTAAAMRDTTPNDLLDRLDAHPSYSVHDEDAVAARQAYADYQAGKGGPSAQDLAAERVRSHLLDEGAPASSIDPQTLDLAAHFHDRGADPGDAWEQASMAEPFPGDVPAERGETAPTAPAQRQLTPEGLDYVKRALGDKVDRAQSAGKRDDARIFAGLKDDLLGAIANHPDPAIADAYGAARQAYAGPSREMDALDAGRRAVGDSVTREQLGRQFGDLTTDGERQRFREGAFGALSEKLAKRPDGGSFVDAVSGSQALRDKLSTLAASPEALSRFHGALDTARQTFTDATRPDVQALHGALQSLDAKVAKGSDAGVQSARDALAEQLGAHPDFARGRAVEANANSLLGALDDGKTALRSGANAIHPADFADRFGARSPAGQSAERIAMRADLDATLRQRVGDVEALRSKLGGDDGFNAAKIGTAFGEDAPNRLQAAVDRERAFSDTESKVVHGSKSAPSLLSAERLKASQPGAMNLSGATLPGLTLQAGKRMFVDPIVKALTTSSNAPRDLEIARALIAQGSGRDQILSSLARIEAQRGRVAGVSNRLAVAARGAIAGTAPGARPLLDVSPGKLARNAFAPYLHRSDATLAGKGDRQ